MIILRYIFAVTRKSDEKNSFSLYTYKTDHVKKYIAKDLCPTEFYPKLFPLL
jgi:hypothetical protein